MANKYRYVVYHKMHRYDDMPKYGEWCEDKSDAFYTYRRWCLSDCDVVWVTYDGEEIARFERWTEGVEVTVTDGNELFGYIVLDV